MDNPGILHTCQETSLMLDVTMFDHQASFRPEYGTLSLGPGEGSRCPQPLHPSRLEHHSLVLRLRLVSPASNSNPCLNLLSPTPLRVLTAAVTTLYCVLLPRSLPAATSQQPALLSPMSASSDPDSEWKRRSPRTQESGLPVTLSCAYKVYLTIIHAPNMSPEERITEAHM